MIYLVKKKLPLNALRLIDLLLSPLHRKASFHKIEKILLCNIAHLGDVVISTTVLPLLRAAFPQAKIGFLCASSSSCVLREHPEISWLHHLDHWKLNRSSSSKYQKIRRYYETKSQVVEELTSIGYDVAIDLYPFFPNVIPVLWKAGIPIRIGYTSGGFGPLLTHPLDWEERKTYLAHYYVSLLQQLPVKIASEPLVYSLPLNKDRAEYNPFILFHMGSGSTRKEWPEAKWREVAISMKEYKIVFTGKGVKENTTIQRVTQGLSHCVNLCDKLSWSELCSVVSQANQVVTVDSVVSHLAAAFEVSCLVIIMDLSSDSTLWTPPGIQSLPHPSSQEILHKLFPRSINV